MKFNLITLLIFVLAISGYSQTPALTVRNAHSLVFDENENRVLLFGGANERQVWSDLWSLGKNGWNLVKIAEGPGPRTFASFVYDQKHSRSIVFGGNKVLFGNDKNPPVFYFDTWEFKNGQWKEIKPSNNPEPRAEAAIVYDKSKERILLFGGYRLEKGKLKRFADTWEFKGNVWRKINDNQISARNGAAIAYDSKQKRVVLFGGSTANKEYGENTGETWVLEKDEWRKLDIVQPPNIFNSNLVFQHDTSRVIRFGGWNGTRRISETWVLSGNSWSKLSLKTNPNPRNHASMVYNPVTKETILFGGHDGEKIFGDLWIFRQGKWYKELEHPPIKRIANGH